VRALLAYLAVESASPHARTTLAGLFWPEYPEKYARRAERIPIRFDALGREQLETIAARTGLSHQDVLRLALHRLVENATVHANKQNQ